MRSSGAKQRLRIDVVASFGVDRRNQVRRERQAGRIDTHEAVVRRVTGGVLGVGPVHVDPREPSVPERDPADVGDRRDDPYAREVAELAEACKAACSSSRTLRAASTIRSADLQAGARTRRVALLPGWNAEEVEARHR